ncbi:nitroreductase [Vibrio sp. Hep-1b-8]|nr:nitroreductase [Vibrio sp. Hep-1b-8]
MKWFIALLVLIAFTNANAFSRVPNVPEDMPAWRIGYAMSTLYPVKVTQAYGVNDSRGWTSFIHNDVLFFGRTELKEMRKYAPNYDGYSIALGIPVEIKSQVAPTSALPDSIYLYWASVTNQRFFATKFDLTPKMKTVMSTKEPFIRFDGFNTHCYRSDIVFGFLPNGNTKVWLDGCGEYKFVTELEPIKELDMDSFGNDAEIIRDNYSEDMAERAKQLGATLDPIPWDKVNKVFSKEEITKLEL